MNASHHYLKLSFFDPVRFFGPQQLAFSLTAPAVDSSGGPKGYHVARLLGHTGRSHLQPPHLKSGSLPSSSCSRDRDTVTSSPPPTRDALTSGSDMRMKGGMKTKVGKKEARS